MLKNLLFSRDTENAVTFIEALLKYRWLLLKIFLALWLFLSVTGSSTVKALTWASLKTLFFGSIIVNIIASVKRIKVDDVPETELYYPTPKLSQDQIDKWNKDVQQISKSQSQIDNMLNRYRKNSGKLDIEK